MRRTLLACLALLLAAPAVARAQRGQVTIQPFAGGLDLDARNMAWSAGGSPELTFPLSNPWMAGARLGLGLSRHWALEASYGRARGSYGIRCVTGSDEPCGIPDDEGDVDATARSLAFRLALPVSEEWRMVAIAGMGSLEVEVGGPPIETAVESIAGSRTDGSTWEVGFGVEWRRSRHWGARLEARNHAMDCPDAVDRSRIGVCRGDETLHHLEWTGGATYTF